MNSQLQNVLPLCAETSSPAEQCKRTLEKALALPCGNQNGMTISLFGVLSHAHRSLNAMSQPFEDMPEHIQSQFDDRLMEVQPGLHNFAVLELAKHLGMLKAALEEGDAAMVRQILDLYVYD